MKNGFIAYGQISFIKNITYKDIDEETEKIIDVFDKRIQFQFINENNEIDNIEIKLNYDEDISKLSLRDKIKISVSITCNKYRVLKYTQNGKIEPDNELIEIEALY